MFRTQVDLAGDGGSQQSALAALFAEELGLVVEVSADSEASVTAAYSAAGLPVTSLGSVMTNPDVSITVGGQAAISGYSTTPSRHLSRRHGRVSAHRYTGLARVIWR